MTARLLLKERIVLDVSAFAEIVVWQVPAPVRASTHTYKYRLALVVDEVCVLRYDNEAGKVDHRHLGGTETQFAFDAVDDLITAFWRDVDEWLETRGRFS